MSSQTKPKPATPPAYAVAIRQAREGAKISQRQLGKIVGCNQPTVANIESGRHTPSPELLGLIHKALGIVTAPEGTDLIALRDAYLGSRRNKRVSYMVSDTRRWPLVKVQEAVRSVARTNTKTFEDLFAMGGEEAILEGFFAELCAHTESFIQALCKVSGWTRADIMVTTADLVTYSKQVAKAPEAAPPAWLQAAAEAETVTTLVDEPEEFIAPTYVPYVPAPKPAAPEAPKAMRRALVVSNDLFNFQRRYADKLAAYDVVVVKVVEADRDIDGDITSVDIIIACTYRMGHSRYYALKNIARKAGKKVIDLDQRRSTWDASFGHFD